MKIKTDLNITEDVLMDGIDFLKDARRDAESCEKIKELSELLTDVIYRLNTLRFQTLQEPNNLSGTRIRNQIDELFRKVEIEIQDLEVE
ncbi:hypothetical protein PZN56_11015 [Staphylococcus epidermidis]|jgi:phage protein|uniref:hypothetical protein n=1 Tax=Staphylococcus TaxID=1279 RepID=UPI00025B4F5B|nr:MULTISPECIES: hypothetical protein [Staphylococcus]EID36510.1 hypothetical protein IS250_0543 [Staphylococcus epidermidis IS-250]MBF2173615.1 hypothetical protein [Staphylococcus epidermidis]MBF2187545.1 hypothetical protein [Staphylococcus epidermidis]MCG1422097.1 hypothetical protein [Staphylococcus epidermidis]MCG1549437.1 hypothetical protein [Staphylococcus epidermidis]